MLSSQKNDNVSVHIQRFKCFEYGFSNDWCILISHHLISCELFIAQYIIAGKRFITHLFFYLLAESMDDGGIVILHYSYLYGRYMKHAQLFNLILFLFFIVLS